MRGTPVRRRVGTGVKLSIKRVALGIATGGYYNPSGSYFSIYTIEQGSVPFSQEGIAESR
jgi:hypothetical protein